MRISKNRPGHPPELPGEGAAEPTRTEPPGVFGELWDTRGDRRKTGSDV